MEGARPLGGPERTHAFELLGEVRIARLKDTMTLCRWRPLAPRSED